MIAVPELKCKHGCINPQLIAYDNGMILCLNCKHLQRPRRASE